MEQRFLAHDPDIECALKFQHNHKFCAAKCQELHKQFEKKQPLIADFVTTTTKKTAKAAKNERHSSFESRPLIVLDITDTSTDDRNFDPVFSIQHACYKVAMKIC
ncbi:hypothetical protein TNCV_890601 [Trichonephila clavipes]|nr:hypothetical protein TNCV_890601 [Trichonephila clavipes]